MENEEKSTILLLVRCLCLNTEFSGKLNWDIWLEYKYALLSKSPVTSKSRTFREHNLMGVGLEEQLNQFSCCPWVIIDRR